jgi:hypothetical protein
MAVPRTISVAPAAHLRPSREPPSPLGTSVPAGSLRPRADLNRRLEGLRSLKRVLDEAFRVPGTKLRFGWDALIGMIPWAGDVVTALFGSAIIVQAHQMRVPRVIQLRMLINIAIDVCVGIVPFLGDVADVFWKSNSKNFALLERHAGAALPPSRGDRIFVTGVVGAVVLVAAAPLIMVYWFVHTMIASGILK